MKCTEKGCDGTVGPRTVGLQTGCYAVTQCPYCEKCGAVYSPDGVRMYQRGFDNKPFVVNGEVVQKPTAEEEVRFLKVRHAVEFFDSYPEEWQAETLEFLKKTAGLYHAEDCKSNGTCTCGIVEAWEFLKSRSVAVHERTCKYSECGVSLSPREVSDYCSPQCAADDVDD